MKKNIIKSLKKVEKAINSDNWQYIAVYAAALYLVVSFLK